MDYKSLKPMSNEYFMEWIMKISAVLIPAEPSVLAPIVFDGQSKSTNLKFLSGKTSNVSFLRFSLFLTTGGLPGLGIALLPVWRSCPKFLFCLPAYVG